MTDIAQHAAFIRISDGGVTFRICPSQRRRDAGEFFFLNTSPFKEIRVVGKMFGFVADRISVVVGKINGVASN